MQREPAQAAPAVALPQPVVWRSRLHAVRMVPAQERQLRRVQEAAVRSGGSGGGSHNLPGARPNAACRMLPGGRPRLAPAACWLRAGARGGLAGLVAALMLTDQAWRRRCAVPAVLWNTRFKTALLSVAAPNLARMPACTV